MWRAVMLNEMRENRWKAIILAAILLAVAIAQQVTHGMVTDWFTQVGEMPAIPLVAQVQEQLADPLRYHWGNWYAKNLYQFTSLFAVLIGMSAIAGEIARGTAPFLFTRPLSRRALLSAKVTGGYTLLAGAIVVPTLSVMLIARLGGMTLPLRFLAGLPMALLGGLVLYLLAVVASILWDDQVKAAVAAMGAILVLAVPGWIQGWAQFSLFRQMAGIPLLFGAPWPYLPLLVVALAGAVLYGLAVYLLQRKEFVG